MIKNITLGQYFPGNSIIHKLDPRIKLLLTIALIVLVFLVHTYWGYLAVFGLVMVSVLLSGIHPKYVLKSIKPLWLILIFTFVLNIFFYSGGEIIFKWWIIAITDEGIKQAVFLALRLVFLILATSLLTLTTSPIEFTDGLESLMKPLKVIHFPVHELAMMMTIAIRFIPTLLEETDKIMNAQTARGAEFDSGNVFKRAYNMVPLLVPLFVSAFRRADELALAMESRCYMGGNKRTRMKVLSMHLRDLAASVVVAGLIVFMAFGF
jgi:energy-coupling factor transport system permease protein